jgi:hypothetical protein
MRTRLFPLAALLALAAAWPAAAEDKKSPEAAKKPTVVVRLAPLDTLVAKARYLAKLAGKGNEAEQVEGVLKAMTSDKGLEGLDTTKPMGLYGYLTPSGYDSEAVLLLPIVDEKTFREKIESFGMKPEKGEDGVWKLDVEKVPYPIFFKFANNYVYATLRDAGVLANKRLLDPATVLAGSGVASAVVNLDMIPRELKEIALSQSELQLSTAKDKEMPGETAAQKGFRLALLDETYSRLKELLYDGGALSVQIDVDSKAGELTVQASLAGKHDSKMAAAIAELGKVTSVAAGVVSKDAAMSIQLDAALPVKLREALGPVIEEAFQQVLEKEKDEAKRKLAEPLLKIIAPTAKMGELDAGASLLGPDSGGLYTFLVGVKIKDGKALDQAFKDGLKESPAKVQGALSIDFAKVGEVGIHKAVPDKVDDHTRKLLGDNPVYFAFRDDALLVSGGAGGLEAIKGAVTAGPASGKILQLDVAAARIATHLADQHKEAPAIAKRVFKGGDDTIRVTLEGGAALKLSLNMKAQLVKFFAELGETKKEE